MAKRDKYDRAVEWLTNHPEDIYEAWNMASTLSPLRGSVLFLPCAPSLNTVCGCLTQVRAGDYEAETEALTTAIRKDRTIPKDARRIKPRHLKRFAYWQRRLDKELGR